MSADHEWTFDAPDLRTALARCLSVLVGVHECGPEPCEVAS